MMYFLIASVFINGAAEASHFKCSTAPSNTIANEMGFESTGSLAVYYTWNNGKVPYFFTNGVTQQDRIFVKEQMQLIESKTCVRFIEGSHFSDEIHHMEIDVEPRSCGESSSQGFGTTFSAFVEPQQGLKVLFKSHYQFADKHFCRGNNTIISGGVIHELFHALGAIHTHQREDKESMLPTIKDVSEIQIIMISLPLRIFPYQLILMISSMSSTPSCTITVTHGVGVKVEVVSAILYSQKMEPLALS